MLVLGFLASAVGAFPLADVLANTTIDEDTPFTTEAAEQAAAQIGTMYTSIIDDMMTFADNPDLALGASRRVTMTAYAEHLAGRFQRFAQDLQAELDVITEAPLAPLVSAPSAASARFRWTGTATSSPTSTSTTSTARPRRVAPTASTPPASPLPPSWTPESPMAPPTSTFHRRQPGYGRVSGVQ